MKESEVAECYSPLYLARKTNSKPLLLRQVKTETETETDRDTERDRDRDRDSDKGRDRDRERQRQRQRETEREEEMIIILLFQSSDREEAVLLGPGNLHCARSHR